MLDWIDLIQQGCSFSAPSDCSVALSSIFSSVPLGEPSELQDKKARLAEDLSEKILHRPGPLELVKKNILSLDPGIKDAMMGNGLRGLSGEMVAFEGMESSHPALFEEEGWVHRLDVEQHTSKWKHLGLLPFLSRRYLNKQPSPTWLVVQMGLNSSSNHPHWPCWLGFMRIAVQRI